MEKKNTLTEPITIIGNAIENGKNIIVCNTNQEVNIKKHFNSLLDEHEYYIYNGVEYFQYQKKINGTTYNYKKFFIEEANKKLLSNILEDYEYIEI